MKTLLNPYSVQLQKHPFMQVPEPPVFEDGDYKIYKYYDNHFVHTYKNIVIAERGKANKGLIHNVKTDTKPLKNSYHDFQRSKDAKEYGIQAAKKLNFQII